MSIDDAPVPLDDLLAHRAWVRRMAQILAGDDGEAADIEQDAWVGAIEHPPQDARSLRAWFAQLLRHRLLNRRRGDARRVRREQAVRRDAASPPTGDVVAQAALHQSVVDAVMSLDEPYRTTVLLRFFEDLPPREVARRQGVAVETVRSRVRRAVGQLRTRLDRDAGERRAWALPLLGWARETGVGPVTGSAAAATSSSASVASGTAAGLIGGSIVASTSSKVAVAAVVALLVWAGASLTDSDSERGIAVSEVPAADVEVPARGSVRHVDAEPETAAGGAVGPTSGGDPFERVDREKDVHGMVVDAEGNPIGDATVQLISRPWRDAGLRSGMQRSFEAVDGPADRSRADGSFVLPSSRGKRGDLLVRADGYASRTVSMVGAGERVEVVLSAGVELTVHVETPDRVPVASADVTFWAGPEFAVGDVIHLSGTTGRDGRCILPRLPTGASGLLYASHDQLGLSDMVSFEAPSSSAATARVTLQPGRIVRGRAVDALTGVALTDAVVEVDQRWRSAVDETGSFRAVLDDSGTFSVSAPGYASEKVQVSDQLTYLDVRLQPALPVCGRIVDVNGQPVTDAWLQGIFRDARVSTRVDDAGLFTLDRVPSACGLTIAVFAEGHGRVLVDAMTPKTGTLDVGDIVLPAPRAIGGVVKRADGTPAKGVDVMLVGTNGDREARTRHGRPSREKFIPRLRTDDLGRFRFNDLSAGEWHVTARFGRGDELTERVVLGSEADVTDLVLSAELVSFRVRVRDEEGRPRAGVALCVSTAGGQRRAVTEADGGVSVDAPGVVHAVWLHQEPGDGGAFRLLSESGVPEGATEWDLVVREMVWIEGRVEDPDGQPLTGEVLALGPDGSAGMNAFPDAATGEFRMRVAPDTVWDLEYDGTRGPSGARDWAGSAVAVPAGSRDVVVRVRPSKDAGFRIVVRTADGDPVPGVRLRFSQRPAGSSVYRTTDAAGRATWTNLPSRIGRVWIEKEEFGSAPRWRDEGWLEPSLWLRARPRDQEIIVTLRRAQMVEGRVDYPAGFAPARSMVYAASIEGTVATANVATDGSFRIPLPVDDPGPFRIAMGVRTADGRTFEGEVLDVQHGESGVVVEVRETKTKTKTK